MASGNGTTRSGQTGVVGSPSDVMRYIDSRKTGRAKSRSGGRSSSGGGGGGNAAGRAMFQRTLARGRRS